MSHVRIHDAIDVVSSGHLGLPARGTAAERRQAALAVCHRATDADDARELLAMLGLLEERE